MVNGLIAVLLIQFLEKKVSAAASDTVSISASVGRKGENREADVRSGRMTTIIFIR